MTPAANADAPKPLSLLDLARAVRTRQWAKNALLFAGLIFAGRLREPLPAFLLDFGRVVLAFGCFCAFSGAAYLINDWQDLERDRNHPVKKFRPMASGTLPVKAGLALALGLLMLATVGSALVALALGHDHSPYPWAFGATAAAYFLVTVAYSLWFKHQVILDVLILAAGFVLRVVAGCVAIPVGISPWIIFCTFTLALFVSLCKRRAELSDLGASATTRRVLQGYSVPMLDTFIAVAACLTITAYSLYTFNAPHTLALGLSPQQEHTPWLMTSIPLVVYGVFRYLLLALSSPVGEEPEQMLRDKPLLFTAFLWIVWVGTLTLLN